MLNWHLDTVGFYFAVAAFVGIAILSVLMASLHLEIKALREEIWRREANQAIESEHAIGD